MRGKSQYKTRCGKFKRIGDGLQADCLADDGYTFDFYFRNEPVDAEWKEMGLSPLHCRLMHMFCRLKDDGHVCNMDNLYNSVNFARAAYSLEVPQGEGEDPVRKRVKTQGVIRASGRGVPKLVKQEIPKKKSALDAARGTTKVAVLKGDPMSDDLLVGSCVDQKCFYMISTAAEFIDWVTKEKKIYSEAAGEEVVHQFLRWSLSDEYNQEMNDNDIADQLRLVYRCLRFMRNTKWWWCEFLFIWETSLVNSYLSMKRYHEALGVEPKWTHWEFNESVAWALLDPKGPGRRKTGKTGEMVASRRKAQLGPRRDRLTSKSLQKGGDRGMRLDRSLYHFPSPVDADRKKTTVCQLHRVANKEVLKETNIPPGARKDVFVCNDCDVALCVECWPAFHQQQCFKTEDYWKILGRK